ncbi:MAG: hypothetical protein KDC38_20145, partial [Planctomycetes bacterium]|nr:hypothetical protein [Planctomycetota bacterium]
PSSPSPSSRRSMGNNETRSIQLHDRRPLLGRLWRKARKAVRGWKWRRRFARFGEGSDVGAGASIGGARFIEIGRSVWIWPGARLEAMGPDEGKPKIRIGDGCKIHPGIHIGAVERVTIGDGVLIAANVYISDHDHDFSDPFDPVVSNARVRTAPVDIGDYVWLGEQVMVLKGVTIGERSIVGAGSIVTRDVPPLSIVVGTPARVVRRYDTDLGEWVDCRGTREQA